MSRYIDTEKADDVIENELGVYDTTELKEMLKYFPTEDVAPVVHAKWIEDGYQDEPYVCSNCGWAENDDMHRITGGYCVCCGAKMDE